MNIQRKVCMLGSYGAGKTSLVNQYVRGFFSGIYQTTIGARIDKKEVLLDGVNLQFILWDLAGEDAFETMRPHYLRGAHGCLLVVDGTRESTFEEALAIFQREHAARPEMPIVAAVNKLDLEEHWQVTPAHISRLEALGCPVLKTTAKEAASVEGLFATMGRQLLAETHIAQAS